MALKTQVIYHVGKKGQDFAEEWDNHHNYKPQI